MAQPKRRTSAAQRDLNDREHVLYRFWDAHDVLLYVGISVDSPTRIANHMRDKPWWGDVETIKFTKYPNRKAALEAEAEMIRTLKPLYNVVHNEMVDADDDDAPLDEARDLAVDVLGSMFSDERDGYLAMAGSLLEGDDQSERARYLAAASYATGRVMRERHHTMRLLIDLLVLSGSDPWVDIPGVAGLDTEVATLIAHADLVVQDLAVDYLAQLHADEAEEWRQSAIAAGITDPIVIERWAARYAASWATYGWLPVGHCAGPGRSGARCTRLVETTVYFELCSLCQAESPCKGHGRWCYKHAHAAHYGRFELLADDPLAAHQLARIVDGPPRDEVPF